MAPRVVLQRELKCLLFVLAVPFGLNSLLLQLCSKDIKNQVDLVCI